jgi:hypothetical protein
MKTATSLTLVAAGAIIAFAITAHIAFLNLQVTGIWSTSRRLVFTARSPAFSNSLNSFSTTLWSSLSSTIASTSPPSGLP